MRWSAWLACWTVMAAARRLVFFPADPLYVSTFRIGNHPNLSRAQIAFEHNGMLLIDIHCGLFSHGCPRYCSEAALSEMFCPMSCYPITTQERMSRCIQKNLGTPTKYNSMPKSIGKTWKRRFGYSKTMSGMWALDDFEIRATQSEQRHKSFGRFPKLRLMSAFSADAKLIGVYDAIVGIAPDRDAIPLQLHKNSQILHPIVSISRFGHNPNWVPFVQKSSISRMAVFGGFDKARCADWVYFPAVPWEYGWTIEFDAVEVLGEVFEEKAKVSFLSSDTAFQLPANTISHLLKKQKLQLYTDTLVRPHQYQTPISLQLSMSFRIGNQNLSIPSDALEYHETEDFEHMLTYFVESPTERYTDRRVYTVGSSFLIERCIGFDYERMLVGIGKHRYPMLF